MNNPIEYKADVDDTTTIRLVHFTTVDFKHEPAKNAIRGFFSLYDNCRVKYSKTIMDSSEEVKDDIILYGDISTSDKRRAAAAIDLIDALCDNETDVIWLCAGGDPKNTQKSEEILARFVYELHTNSVHLHNMDNFTPKPMIGYCFVTPILLYLSQRGLVKAIHGELGLSGIDHIAQDRLSRELYRNIVKPDYTKNHFKNLKPENHAAHHMIATQSEINGVIMGGLLQIVRSEIEIALQIERKIGLNLIKDKPIILFVEAISTGNELNIAKEIFKFVIDHGLQIKALGVGCIHDFAKVEGYLKEVSAAANGLNIPVVSGLKIGHMGKQEPVLMSYGTLKYDPTTNSLVVSYENDKKSIGLLKSVKAQSIWNKTELRNNGIECGNDEKNISQEMCVIL